MIVPEWEKLKAEYDSTEHEVMTDKVGRKDRKGVKAARITYGMQKLATRRMTQMAFTVPVKRNLQAW